MLKRRGQVNLSPNSDPELQAPSMQTTDKPQTAYDRVPYPSGVFPQTHPNRLATVAFLRGMDPAPVSHCRVLELACGTAANLVSFGHQFPESEFVGVDLARLPIAAGKSLVADLGLQNVALHALDLCEASEDSLGKFDYIIAHGVYSWVAHPVRERILEICRQMLTARGIAYISYNAYPGNHFRDLVRAIMRFHTQNFDTVQEKARQGRALIKFLAESRPKTNYYVESLRAQLERIERYQDESLYHDDLSPINQPFYFHEFMADAQRYGLKYVGEAAPGDLESIKFTPEVINKMNELQGASEIVREQYRDFLSGCGFRQTLLCRDEIELAPDLQVNRIPALFAMCDAVLVENSQPGKPPQFKYPRGDVIECGHALTQAALEYLTKQWPAAVPFDPLLQAAVAKTNDDPSSSPSSEQAVTLAESLAKSYQSGLISLNVHPPNVANRVSRCPAISKLARTQMQRGRRATTQLHTSLQLPDDLAVSFALLLDGTRDEKALFDGLLEKLKSGEAKFIEADVVVKDEAKISVLLQRRIKEGLQSFLRAGILVK
jgi:SAM-dependent methyltransferase